MDNRTKRVGLFFPILLVGLGVLLLLINLDLLTGTTRENLLTYWPVLLILAGLDGLWRREGLVWNIVLLGLGVLLLLGNLGYLAVRALPLLTKIWPILLVAIGIDIAFGRNRTGWMGVLRVGLGVLLVGVIFWLAVAFPLAVGTRVVDFEQTIDDAESASIEFHVIGGRVKLAAGAAEDQLLAGQVVLPRYSSLAPVYSSPVNGKSSLRLGVENGNNLLAGGLSVYDYDFKLSSSLPIDLLADVVVGEVTLDLSGTQVQWVDTELALGAQTLTIPCNDGLMVEMKQALGSVTLNIPEGCDVTIRLDNALVNTSLPPGWQRTDDLVTNPHAPTGAGKVEIRIGVAVGAVGIHEIE